MMKFDESIMECNVYDFDGTIYDGDSTVDFYFFSIKRHPKAICALPSAVAAFISYKLKRRSKTQFKERFYDFLGYIPDINSEVLTFWKKNKAKIKKWYQLQHTENDVVVSASPYFLLKPICEELEIDAILASMVEPQTGLTQGKNCFGAEKVRRLHELFPNIKILNFYSDSRNDTPLADISEKSWLVKKDTIVKWL